MLTDDWTAVRAEEEARPRRSSRGRFEFFLIEERHALDPCASGSESVLSASRSCSS